MEYEVIKGRKALLQAIKKDAIMVDYQVIEIPETVTVNVDEESKIISIEGENGKVKKDFGYMNTVEVIREDDKLYIARRIRHRKDKSPIRTIASRIRNTIEGVQKRFVAHHKVVFSHFPVRVYTEGDSIVLENFYGKREDIKIPITGKNTEVEVETEEGSNVPSDVYIKGPDKDAVTRTSSALQETCKLRGKRRKDVRVFQDGIWLYRLRRERK